MFVPLSLLLPVSDGQHTSPEMALTIHLLHSDRQPPAFQIKAPLLEVSPGGRTPLGENWGGLKEVWLGHWTALLRHSCLNFLMVAQKAVTSSSRVCGLLPTSILLPILMQIKAVLSTGEGGNRSFRGQPCDGMLSRIYFPASRSLICYPCSKVK